MELLFVYNANSGTLNTLFDIGHKLFNPSTYSCRLCALTYDKFKENNIWKSFRTESDMDMRFYHKDEFETEFPEVHFKYPIVLKLEAKKLTVILNRTTLEGIATVDDLITALKTSL